MLVKLFGLSRREKYTALSRVRSIKDLYIEGTFEPPRPANTAKDIVLKEMKRLRENCLYNFKLQYPESNSRDIKAIYHNVRSLVKYIEYIKSDFNYTNCDIILLSETRTKNTSYVDIEGYKEICRIDGAEESNHAYGMIVYAKVYLQPSINIVSEICRYSRSENGVFRVEIIGMKILYDSTNIGIVSIYKSPKCTTESFTSLLGEVLDTMEKLSNDNIFIVGDFNINWFVRDKDFTFLIQFMNAREYVMVNREEASTDNQSLLDMCFAKHIPTHCHIMESVISDHKPIWFSLN